MSVLLVSEMGLMEKCVSSSKSELSVGSINSFENVPPEVNILLVRYGLM